MSDQIRVGTNSGSAGAYLAWRGTHEAAQVVADNGTRYGEACARDQVFHASILSAGVAPGTAISTAPPIVVYNPVNSGKNLEVIRGTLGYVSGTLGAGSIAWLAASAQQAADPTGGTALTVRNGRIGGSDAATVAKAFTGSTVSATPFILRPAFFMGAALASTAFGPAFASEVASGEIVVAPGYFVAMQGISAAGSSPLVLLSITWREAAVVS